MRTRQYEPKAFYAYINSDGSHYFPDGSKLFEPIEEVPDDVDCLHFKIRTLKAQYTMKSEATLSNRAAVAAIKQVQGGDDIDEKEGLNEVEMRTQELCEALVEWDLLDEAGVVVPITLNAIEDLEPRWLYDIIRAAHQNINSAKNLQAV